MPRMGSTASRSDASSPGPTMATSNRSSRSSASSKDIVSSSGAAAVTRSPRGDETATEPAPKWSADLAARTLAPTIPVDPPATRTAPADHLWERRGRGGRGASSSSASHIEASPPSIPMSAIVTTPQWSGPCPRTWPVFSVPNVTVSTARKARSSISPSSGRARSGNPPPTPAAGVDIHATTSRGRPPRAPPPNNASMTRSAPLTAARPRIGTPRSRARAAALIASGELGSVSAWTSTAAPRPLRYRAAT